MLVNALIRTQGASTGRDRTMRRVGLAVAVAATIATTGCATNPYGYDPYGYNSGYYNNTQASRAATGAAVGALGGAAVGAIVPGISPIGGAVAGAVLGGVLGAVVNGRQYYRDTRGYCYYVDQYGQPHYNYNVRC